MNRAELIDKSLEELYSLAYPDISGMALYEAVSIERTRRGIGNYKIGDTTYSAYSENQRRIEWFKNITTNKNTATNFYVDTSTHSHRDYVKQVEEELLRSKYKMGTDPYIQINPMTPDECFKIDENTLLLLC
jgi:hypothetical protein